MYKDLSSKLKKYAGGLYILLLISAIASLFAFAFWYGISGWRILKDVNPARQISVNGEGKITVRPDVAVFSASIVTYAKKVKDAQSENTNRSNAVLDFLKNKGVLDKDLKTVGYFISPSYQYFDTAICLRISCPPRRPPEIISYEVRHTIEVKVRDLGKTDELLEGVVTNGANEIGSVSFRIDNEENAKAEARKRAIYDAKAKAAVLANDLRIRLGKIINFSESGSPIPIYYAESKAVGLGQSIKAPTPQVEPGEQEIHSAVTITFEMR